MPDNPYLPTEASTLADDDPLFYGEQLRPGPYRPLYRRGAEGQQLRPDVRPVRESPYNPQPQIICHKCYVVGERVRPDCGMKIRDIAVVVHNYNKLVVAQKERVPIDAYHRALALLNNQVNVAGGAQTDPASSRNVGALAPVGPTVPNPKSAPPGPKN